MNTNILNIAGLWILGLLMIALPICVVAIRQATPRYRYVRILQTILAGSSILLTVPFVLAFPNAYDGWKHHHEAYAVWASFALTATGIQLAILALSVGVSVYGKMKVRSANQAL